MNVITKSVENANFFGIWEKPGLSICVSLCIGFWQMRKTFWNTSTDSVTLGNSEALGKMQKESEKGFPQLIEKLGLLDAQGGHKIIHYITLMNFHPLGRLLYIVVYWNVVFIMSFLKINLHTLHWWRSLMNQELIVKESFFPCF